MSLRTWIINQTETPEVGLFKLILRYLLKYYLPAIVLLWGIVWLVQWTGRIHVEKRLGESVQEELLGVETLWRHEVTDVTDEVRFLSDNDLLRRWLKEKDVSSRHDLEMAWYYFSMLNRLYDRIRFIDDHGMERIHINKSSGSSSEIIGQSGLQDVSKDALFAVGMRLEVGEIYGFQLEQSAVKQGVESIQGALLRLVEPVYMAGERRGIVVVDLQEERLVSILRGQSLDAWHDHLIVTENGDYLLGVMSGSELRSVSSGGQFSPNFAIVHPEVWQRMQGKNSEYFYLNDVGYVYRKVEFPWSTLKVQNKFGKEHWFFVHLIAPETVDEAMLDSYKTSHGIATVASFLLLLFLLIYVKVYQAKEGYLSSASALGAKLQGIMDTAPDAIFTFDDSGRIESFNEATLRMFACSEEEFSPSRLSDLIPENYEELVGLIKKSQERSGDFRMTVRREFNARRFDDSWFPVEFSVRETRITELHDYIVIARDISEHKAVEAQAQRRALYDDLTNLPNRILLRSKLDSLIALSLRRDMYGALLFMDLDNFKNINDSMGHLAGDMLLCRVAERLTRTLRNEDMVSRLGGDEFVAVLPMLSGDQRSASVTAREVAEKLRLALNQPLMLEGHEYITTPSIGIVLFPTQGITADDVLRQADTAMYRAKAAGRNTIRFFHPSMQTEVNDRLRVGKELRLAVEQGQLELYLQPQVDAEFDCIVGAEALIRWNHPTRGLLGPGHFIPHAEELGMIGLIGEWVLREGFSILKRLLEELPCRGFETLAINLSPRHFRSPDFIPRLRTLMLEYQVPAHRIELEITENLLLEDMEEAVVKMNAINEMGIRFAIDDFGTGFSSLTYLRRLPLGRLKIDRSFITEVDSDARNAAMVETILAMAKIQKLAVTAEGVEREEEKRWLLERGCSHIQGFYYSRPIDVVSFVKLCHDYELKNKDSIEVPQP